MILDWQRTIAKGIVEKKSDLINIIKDFHKTIKPEYTTFISPTKRYTDIILPNSTVHVTTVKIITNYLKLLLEKVSINNTGIIFSFLNEIIVLNIYFSKIK